MSIKKYNFYVVKIPRKFGSLHYHIHCKSGMTARLIAAREMKCPIRITSIARHHYIL